MLSSRNFCGIFNQYSLYKSHFDCICYDCQVESRLTVYILCIIHIMAQCYGGAGILRQVLSL